MRERMCDLCACVMYATAMCLPQEHGRERNILSVVIMDCAGSLGTMYPVWYGFYHIADVPCEKPGTLDKFKIEIILRRFSSDRFSGSTVS